MSVQKPVHKSVHMTIHMPMHKSAHTSVHTHGRLVLCDLRELLAQAIDDARHLIRFDFLFRRCKAAGPNEQRSAFFGALF